MKRENKNLNKRMVKVNELKTTSESNQRFFFGKQNFLEKQCCGKILWVILLFSSLGAFADLQFPNPSLEKDVGNIGYPDGWKIQKPTKFTIVRDQVSNGGKAARFEKGYKLLSCDMQGKKLSGLKYTITFDAKGTDGAQLGVKIGYNKKIKGKQAWKKSMSLWNHKLKNNFERITIKGIFAKNAVGTRVSFAVFRPSRKGIVWLDNFEIITTRGKEMTSVQRKQLNILNRDWTYLASRVTQALEIKGKNPKLLQAKKEVELTLSRIESDNLDLLKESLNLKAKDILVSIMRELAPAADDVAWLSDAYQRIKPDEIIPSKLITSTEITTLGNEYQAFGLSVANIQNKKRSITITLDGGDKALTEIKIRRQVFTTNWYIKERELLTDPLTLLPSENGNWKLPIEAGEIVKLYVVFKVKKDVSGLFPLEVKAGTSRLKVVVKIKGMNLPVKPVFNNFQCMYPGNLPAGKHPELTAKDLAAHYTTAIELPYLPKMVFNPDGTIASEDFANSAQAKWITAYSKEKIKLAIFWMHTGFPIVNSKKKIPYSNEKNELLPVWKKAYTSFLKDWLAFAEKSGVGKENFILWCKDELGSGKEFATAPSSKVRLGIETYKLSREVQPGIPRMITAGIYTLPKDIAAFIPYVDLILPSWPLMRSLPSWAAEEGFNPRIEFFDKTLPLLKKERAKRGLKIWSYRVDAGRAEDVLNNRAYPIGALGIGFTGVGSWAYNCSSATTWDDTDGKEPDYIFVYNGEEKAPLNEKYNVTHEIIVPSIRWEAMRMGIQDAQILLYLKHHMERGEYDDATSVEIKSILKQAFNFGRDLTYSFEKINKISLRIRELVVRKTSLKPPVE